MTIIQRLIGGWRRLIHRTHVEQELDDELRDYLERSTEQKIQTGMTREAAARAARVEMGSPEAVKEAARDVGWESVVDSLWQDMRYALRTLRRSPGFAGVAVVTLALGIGANTTIFSVAHALLFQPLPYPDSHRLMAVVPFQRSQPAEEELISYPTFADWQQAEAFESIAAYAVAGSALTGRGAPTIPETAAVTPNLFELLAARPLLGRTLLPGDARPGAERVVVIGEQFWRDQLGRDPRIVGESLTLDGAAYTVVGVMPASFRFPHVNPAPKLWIPLEQFQPFQQLLTVRLAPFLNVVGRLAHGADPSRAQAEMETIAARLAQQYPVASREQVIAVRSLQDRIVGETRSSLFMLLGAVGLLLLIACTNIASLQLARMMGRGREMAVRAALGAGRRRLFRQILVESLLLTTAGGVAALLVASGGLRALTASIEPDLPQVREIGIDRYVLAFTFVLSSLTGVLFAVLPVAGSSWVEPRDGLKDARTATEDRRRPRMRSLLVVLEVAVAVIMLTGAGLLVRSLAGLQRLDPGFQVSRLWTAAINLPQTEFTTPAQWRAFNAELLDRVRRLPGVERAAFGVGIPFYFVPFNVPFDVEGRPSGQGVQTSTEMVVASPDYFAAMRIPIFEGREFTDADTAQSARVALVNRAFARRFLGDRAPVGQTILFGGPPPTLRLRIVGVVGDTAQMSLTAPSPALVYLPFSQRPFWITIFVIRTAIDPAAIARAFRSEVAAMGPTVAVLGAEPMETLLERSFAASSHRALLLGLLSMLALALTAVGIYGMLSYTVVERTREIGIRMALGAERADVIKNVLRQSLLLTLAGIVCGLAGAAAVTRYLESMLFGVRPLDPATFAGAALLFAAVAALAAYLPSSRATKVDPMIVLRCE